MKPSQNPPKNLYFSLIVLGSTLVVTPAHAHGLQKVKTVLEMIKSEILSIVPIIAIIALIGLGIGYSINLVQKETFIRWVVGLIVVGSAAQLTSMFID